MTMRRQGQQFFDTHYSVYEQLPGYDDVTRTPSFMTFILIEIGQNTKLCFILCGQMPPDAMGSSGASKRKGTPVKVFTVPCNKHHSCSDVFQYHSVYVFIYATPAFLSSSTYMHSTGAAQLIRITLKKG